MTRNQRRRSLREHRRKMRYAAEWRTPWMAHYFPYDYHATYERIWREYRREIADGLYQ